MMESIKTPLLRGSLRVDDTTGDELSSVQTNISSELSATGIRVRRIRKASFRFSECDGDEDLPQFQGTRYTQYFAALAANMGAFALGTVLSWSAVALPDLRTDTAFGIVSETEETWIGSIVTLGAAASGPAAGYLIETIGRRMSMWILAIPFFLGWIIIFFAQNVWMILIGRFVTGFCSGVYAVAAPIFTAEMADVSIRGTLCAGFDMMISVGILFIFVLGDFVPWRMQALICAAFPIIIFVMMIFVPESPRFLIGKGKVDEASAALFRFRGASVRDQIDPELRVLKISIRNSQDKASGFMELFRKPVFRPISIAFLIYFFQVFSGIDPVLFYTVDIFKSAGVTMDPYYSTIIIGTIQVLFAALGALMVEHFGRRILLMVSEAIMVISLGALGFYFYLKSNNGDVSPEGWGFLPLVSLIVYTIAYSVGMGPVGYMIMGEILPHHVKGLAGCILTSAKWLMSFAMTKFFQNIINSLGYDGCYWLFGAFCALGFFYILFFVPETKGKTLDEIQKEFSESYLAGRSPSNKSHGYGPPRKISDQDQWSRSRNYMSISETA